MKSTINLDHIIVTVNDIDETTRFWSKVFGFESEGLSGPFGVMRITPPFNLSVRALGYGGRLTFCVCHVKSGI